MDQWIPLLFDIHYSLKYLRPRNCRWELKVGEKKVMTQKEKESCKDKAESLWSVEQKRCHVDDLVSGGMHRTECAVCLFLFSKETLVWVILAFCEALENIDTHTLTFWMYVDTHDVIFSTNWTILLYMFAMEHVSSKTTFTLQCGSNINLQHTYTYDQCWGVASYM